jgi:hypothetical protein
MTKMKLEHLTEFYGIGFRKEAPSKKSSKRKREIYWENIAYFHIARALYASRPSSDVPCTFTADGMLKPSFLPFVANEYYEMYETYVGDYDGREPRFQFDYLFNIELRVLKRFLSLLRYADKFNEVGEPTTFDVRPDSIRVLTRRTNDQKHFYMEDLTAFSVGKKGTIVAPWDCVAIDIIPIQRPDELLEATDAASDKDSLHELACERVPPKYDDISKRYYVGIPSERESVNRRDSDAHAGRAV